MKIWPLLLALFVAPDAPAPPEAPSFDDLTLEAMQKCSRTEHTFPGYRDHRETPVFVVNEDVMPEGTSWGSVETGEAMILCWDPETGDFTFWSEGAPNSGIPVLWVRTASIYRDIRSAAARALRAQAVAFERTGEWIDEVEELGLEGVDGARVRLTVWEDHWTLTLATDYQSCSVGDDTILGDDVLPTRLSRVGHCVVWYEPVATALRTAWDEGRSER